MAETKVVTACVLIIGNEVLSGRTKDANLNYMARKLSDLGIRLAEARVIPDVEPVIVDAVNDTRRKYDYVFTTGGIGPTHDDITCACIARAFGVGVIRHPDAVALLKSYIPPDRLNEARLKMAEVPECAELTADGEMVFPAIVVRNIYVLPGVPEIFRQKFEALKERFREAPFHLCCVYVSIGEGTLAAHLNAVLAGHPDLLLGSYPEFSNPEYKVKVTLESKNRGYLDGAVADLLARLPGDSVVRIDR